MNKVIYIKININATVKKGNVYVQYWRLQVSGELFWKRKLCVDFVWFDCCHFILWWVCSSIDATTWSNQAVWKSPIFSCVHHCWYSAPYGFPNYVITSHNVMVYTVINVVSVYGPHTLHNRMSSAAVLISGHAVLYLE